MSPKAQIPSHRKPRNSKMNTALRAGVTGGVMGTIALTAAAPSFAADKQAPNETVEMPTLSGNLESSATEAANSIQQSALTYELQEAQGSAVTKAKEQAKENKEKAEAKAKAEAERKAEAARKAARAAAAERSDRASRSDDRSSLQSTAAQAPSSSTPSKATGGGNAASLISFLKGQVGKAYVSGATGPSAYDCSGLTQAAFKNVGVDLPRVSQSQSTAGTPVSLSNVQPGDILYWGSAGSAYHVAVYIGDGKFIGAQNPSKGVVEAPMNYDQPTGAVRVL